MQWGRIRSNKYKTNLIYTWNVNNWQGLRSVSLFSRVTSRQTNLTKIMGVFLHLSIVNMPQFEMDSIYLLAEQILFEFVTAAQWEFIEHKCKSKQQ